MKIRMDLDEDERRHNIEMDKLRNETNASIEAYNRKIQLEID